MLAIVLAIAAIASYIHLRAVWAHAGAPVPDLGPLLPDGLFAASWLRMRRRRRQGVDVGGLAWLALGLALAMTLAGNVAAAWIAGHRDPLSLTVAGIPAAVFALVWELVTGHARHPASGLAAAGDAPSNAQQMADAAGQEPPGDPESTGDGGPGQEPETWEKKRDRLLAEGAGRPRLVEELAITDYAAKNLQKEWRQRQSDQEEATG